MGNERNPTMITGDLHTNTATTTKSLLMALMADRTRCIQWPKFWKQRRHGTWNLTQQKNLATHSSQDHRNAPNNRLQLRHPAKPIDEVEDEGIVENRHEESREKAREYHQNNKEKKTWLSERISQANGWIWLNVLPVKLWYASVRWNGTSKLKHTYTTSTIPTIPNWPISNSMKRSISNEKQRKKQDEKDISKQ